MSDNFEFCCSFRGIDQQLEARDFDVRRRRQEPDLGLESLERRAGDGGIPQQKKNGQQVCARQAEDRAEQRWRLEDLPCRRQFSII